MITTTSWKTTSLSVRTPVSTVYDQIITDLIDAKDLLTEEYPDTGERIRVNKFAAAALLARVYLYKGDYTKAEAEASSVIDNASVYNLANVLSNVFLAGSSESIWELKTANRFPFAVYEAGQFIPFVQGGNPDYYLTDQLIGNFEAGDQRRQIWVDSTNFEGTNYYYPKKYTVRRGESDMPHYGKLCRLLRLAEQYLIRAEARPSRTILMVQLQTLIFCEQELVCQIYLQSLNHDEVINAIMQERRN